MYTNKDIYQSDLDMNVSKDEMLLIALCVGAAHYGVQTRTHGLSSVSKKIQAVLSDEAKTTKFHDDLFFKLCDNMKEWLDVQ